MLVIHPDIDRESLVHPLGTVNVVCADLVYRKFWVLVRHRVEYIAFFPKQAGEKGLSKEHLRAMRLAIGIGSSKEAALLSLAASYHARLSV